MLVDSLKLAKHDLIEIVVDEDARLLTVNEGGDITGTDWSLVEQQRRSNLFHSHACLSMSTASVRTSGGATTSRSFR
jgi:hypothetical protein